ncbi:MAG: DUF5753 domain-containing protein, partial [Pseudonocardia sp.]
RNLGQKGDWTGYRGVYRESVRMLVDLEQASSRIHLVQSEIVPGLLQTENYVRALTEAPSPFGTSLNADDVARTRHERRKIITRDDDPPMLSFILSESALRREYGGRDVMREQMQRLLDIAQLSNVQLQALPFANTSPVTYAWLSFALLHVPGPGLASPLNFAYVEQFDDARYIDERERVDAYERLWSHLQAAALNVVESTDFIAGVASEYT